ncbi:MAG: hypothetical protein M3N19_07615 [Candidatus Eremiobacteraeota bacterium]|nr:hypothetical protein [Candidatus Eremiobacteraeota bacterium]
MSFIAKWLGLSVDTQSGIAVRPARSIEIDLSYDAAFARCLQGLNDIVGAQVRDADLASGTIDATFGLMFSERLACSVTRIDATKTHVLLESRRIAGTSLPKDSAVLDRLEVWVREGR